MLLDDYLDGVVMQQLQQQQQHAGQQQQHGHHQQPRLPTGVAAQTLFLHSQVMQGVHAALDSLVADHTMPPGRDDALPQRLAATPVVLHSTAAGAAAAAASAAGATAPAASDAAAAAGRAAPVRAPATAPKGLFRAMRQADAAALYAQRVAERDDAAAAGVLGLQDQQQPTAQQAAADDGVNSRVRLLAEQTALATKLQRLQEDMEARSYRQQLLERLRNPAALFRQPAAAQQQLVVHCSEHALARPGTAQGRHQFPRSALAAERRPGTSPAASACWQPAPPAARLAAAGNSGTNGDSSGLAAAEPARLQHLRELAAFELPWRQQHQQQHSGAAAQRAAVKPNYLASLVRPHTAGAALGGGGSSSSIAGHNAPQPRLFQPQPHPQNRDVQHPRALQGPHGQQQAVQVQRPESSVAALEQSLSELAGLRTKFTHQQQQQEAQAWAEPSPRMLLLEEQAVQGSGAWQQPDALPLDGRQQNPSSVAGLPTSRHSRALPGWPGGEAAAWQQPAGQQQRQSLDWTHGGGGARYELWEAWQRDVHVTPRSSVVLQPPTAAVPWQQQQQQAAALSQHRSASAPRCSARRVWDVLPPAAAAARAQQQQRAWSRAHGGDATPASPPAARTLFPSGTGSLSSSRGGAALSSSTRPAARPHGPHDAAPGAAAAAQLRAALREHAHCEAATGGGGGGSSLSAWLLSSPLQRQRMLAPRGGSSSAGVRPASWLCQPSTPAAWVGSSSSGRAAAAAPRSCASAPSSPARWQPLPRGASAAVVAAPMLAQLGSIAAALQNCKARRSPTRPVARGDDDASSTTSTSSAEGGDDEDDASMKSCSSWRSGSPPPAGRISIGSGTTQRDAAYAAALARVAAAKQADAAEQHKAGARRPPRGRRDATVASSSGADVVRQK